MWNFFDQKVEKKKKRFSCKSLQLLSLSSTPPPPPHPHLKTPSGARVTTKLFSRSRSTSLSILTCEGSRSLGSLAGRMVSDWKKAAWSRSKAAEESSADAEDEDARLFSGGGGEEEKNTSE